MAKAIYPGLGSTKTVQYMHGVTWQQVAAALATRIPAKERNSAHDPFNYCSYEEVSGKCVRVRGGVSAQELTERFARAGVAGFTISASKWHA